ncbi:alkaline phosphatase family protein [Silvimonas soli]|uniref:alkaline phosphatase family protein n=1 Tax=Silvimonas soli TaxID=2980100 RepID=UPI0024B36D26|nr:alkaline phosphatase family protein [Silvimonas soli]
MFQISVVNGSATLSDRELQRVIRAINRQIAEDFEPFWAFGGRLRLDGSTRGPVDSRQLGQLRGDAILYVLDSATSAGYLGFHDRNQSGVPFGFVFLDLCKQLGDEWSTTLSHEALELIGDPQCNLLVQGPHPRYPDRTVYHYFEMCDAVQTVTYTLDGVVLSDFVLPAYFTADTGQGARTSFCSAPLAPFNVTPGGYIGFFDPKSKAADQYFANDPIAQQRQKVKTGVGIGRVARRGLQTATPVSDPIRHVVVLMLENRSFDHMLGGLTGSIPGLNGVSPNDPRTNVDATTNKAYAQTANAKLWIDANFAPPHELPDVTFQLGDQGAHFVDSYRRALGSKLDAATLDAHQQQIMAYFADGDLPVLHTLAKSFTVCDRWFSSLPGPTWPNRFFVHSATCLGVVDMPSTSSPSTLPGLLTNYNQDTIYDRLDAAQPKRSWKIFHDGFPQTALLAHVRERILSEPYATMADFATACQGSEAAFPAYAFIEPRYFKSSNGPENDQHPPANANDGELLIAQVYNAIRANADLWNSTLLVITWDEHGGFYDHVMPPATIAPDNHTDHFNFQQLGVRVPTLLVSPWVAAGVDHTVYDHSSILRYLCEKWGMPYLGARMDPGIADSKVCGNFASQIKLTQPRTDLVTVTPKAVPAQPNLSPWDSARESLLKFAETVMGSSGSAAAAQGMRAAAVPGLAAAANVDLPVPERIQNVDAWLAARTGRAVVSTSVPVKAASQAATVDAGPALVKITRKRAPRKQ